MQKNILFSAEKQKSFFVRITWNHDGFLWTMAKNLVTLLSRNEKWVSSNLIWPLPLTERTQEPARSQILPLFFLCRRFSYRHTLLTSQFLNVQKTLQSDVKLHTNTLPPPLPTRAEMWSCILAHPYHHYPPELRCEVAHLHTPTTATHWSWDVKLHTNTPLPPLPTRAEMWRYTLTHPHHHYPLELRYEVAH